MTKGKEAQESQSLVSPSLGIYKVTIGVEFPSDKTKKGYVGRTLNEFYIPFTPENANELNKIVEIIKPLLP